MKMTPKTTEIADIRFRYQNACAQQLREIFSASTDQDSVKHDKLMEELETSLIILYRFDRKMKNANTLEDLVAVIGNDSTAGPTS